MSTRGGLVTLSVLDAGGHPATLDMPEGELLGLAESDVVHRLDAARYAECGSAIDEHWTADGVSGYPYLQLCWYCFPRS